MFTHVCVFFVNPVTHSPPPPPPHTQHNTSTPTPNATPTPNPPPKEMQPQAFIDWADAWMDHVALHQTLPALAFPPNLTQGERRAVHSRCTPRGLKSASYGWVGVVWVL